MQPLLKIQNIPINIEYKVTRASLQHQSAPAKVNITRSRGSLNMQSTPPQMKIDSYETRASAGLKSAARSTQEFADRGTQAGYEATSGYAIDGNTLMDNNSKTSVAELAASKAAPRMAETVTAFIPSVPPQIEFTPGTLSFNPTMDQLAFDWNINHKPQLEFIPGGIEFNVVQYPEVMIEYLGSPIYVPPSADPNYTPPPGINTAV